MNVSPEIMKKAEEEIDAILDKVWDERQAACDKDIAAGTLALDGNPELRKATRIRAFAEIEEVKKKYGIA